MHHACEDHASLGMVGGCAGAAASRRHAAGEGDKVPEGNATFRKSLANQEFRKHEKDFGFERLEWRPGNRSPADDRVPNPIAVLSARLAAAENPRPGPIGS